MLCAPSMQLYWALALCFIKLHLESCVFLSRASAEISPLVCVCTSVCVILIHDAREMSLHFECEPCQQGCYQDKNHGCFPRCVRLTHLDRFVDAARADFGCTAGVIFAWDCCRTVFRSFQMLACLLSLLNTAVVPLLSVPDTVSKLILFAVIKLLAWFMPGNPLIKPLEIQIAQHHFNSKTVYKSQHM